MQGTNKAQILTINLLLGICFNLTLPVQFRGMVCFQLSVFVPLFANTF